MRFGKEKGTHELVGQPLLTSLIDVVFLLLVFFMVTSRFMEGESELASAIQSEDGSGGEAADFQPQSVYVVRREDGVNVYRIGSREVDTKAGLKEILQALPKEGGVFIRPSDDVPWAFVVAGMQASCDAGFEKVSYVPGG